MDIGHCRAFSTQEMCKLQTSKVMNTVIHISSKLKRFVLEGAPSLSTPCTVSMLAYRSTDIAASIPFLVNTFVLTASRQVCLHSIKVALAGDGCATRLQSKRWKESSCLPKMTLGALGKDGEVQMAKVSYICHALCLFDHS